MLQTARSALSLYKIPQSILPRRPVGCQCPSRLSAHITVPCSPVSALLTSGLFSGTISGSTIHAKMSQMIITETERLSLRQFHDGDADAMDLVFGDPVVMQYGRGVQTRQWVRDWLDRRHEIYQKFGFGLWAVVESHSQEVIGYCGLTYFPDIGGQPETEIGYRLARPYWGHGYATEAALAVRDYSFDVLKLPRLIALIDPQNVASIRVAKKIGMVYEKDVMLEGYSHPDRVY